MPCHRACSAESPVRHCTYPLAEALGLFFGLETFVEHAKNFLVRTSCYPIDPNLASNSFALGALPSNMICKIPVRHCRSFFAKALLRARSGKRDGMIASFAHDLL